MSQQGTVFTHVRVSRYRNLEDRTGIDSRSSSVPVMLLCCRRVWISNGFLT